MEDSITNPQIKKIPINQCAAAENQDAATVKEVHIKTAWNYRTSTPLPAIFPCAATVTYFPPLYSSLPFDNFSRDVGLGGKGKKKWEHSFLEINLQGKNRSGFLPLPRAAPTLNLHKSPAATRAQQAPLFWAMELLHTQQRARSLLLATLAALAGTQSPDPYRSSVSCHSSLQFHLHLLLQELPKPSSACCLPGGIKPRGSRQRQGWLQGTAQKQGWGRNWDPKPPSSGS